MSAPAKPRAISSPASAGAPQSPALVRQLHQRTRDTSRSPVAAYHFGAQPEQLARRISQNSDVSRRSSTATGRSEDYVSYLRRQKGTVWCDQPQRELNKSSSVLSKESKRRRNAAGARRSLTADGMLPHTHAFYHPKLDMTKELTDARQGGHEPARLSIPRTIDDDPVVADEPVPPAEPEPVDELEFEPDLPPALALSPLGSAGLADAVDDILGAHGLPPADPAFATAPDDMGYGSPLEAQHYYATSVAGRRGSVASINTVREPAMTYPRLVITNPDDL
ncbi:uncharacterized protein V1510DRAFT_412465 [Dipodascopsis tothii]|uniref:uncharacterized protein n=1 Tax=Dipodascopsis tothii TaxID=44089 RepID=UPI0034CF62BB